MQILTQRFSCKRWIARVEEPNKTRTINVVRDPVGNGRGFVRQTCG